ncbi:MAG: acyl-CoA carboxylase subunit beta [Salinarimonas sp.]
MSVIESRIDTRSPAFAENAVAFGEKLAQLRERMAVALAGGPPAHRERHRKRGKHLVRERIDRIVDPATPFLEFSPLAAFGQYGNAVPGAGIVTGIGIIAGKPLVIIANDATVKGGSFFHETVKKHLRAQAIAEENGLGCLYLVDCGGAYLPEQDRVFPDRDHFGTTFLRQCRMSAAGLPQIAVVFGGCTAGGAYIPALADHVVMVEDAARIHLGGPSIVKAAIDETVDGEALGGAAMHTRISGVNDRLAADEDEALAIARDIIAALPERRSLPALAASEPPLHDPAEIPGIISADPRMPYDAHEIIARLVDGSRFTAFKPEWGATLVAGFARIHGMEVGIIGNNGALLSESALKAAHFIMLCDQQRIPLLFLHNITGYMVGSEAERGGIAKHSAKMVYAMASARVPKLSVVIGGSYGAGNYGMCGRGFDPRFLFAWPTARVATMSADIASNVMQELRRSTVSAGEADDAVLTADLAAIDRRVRAQYAEQSDPYYATSRLWDDGIIEPSQTRDVLGLCLSLAVSAPEPEPGRHAPVYRL